MLETDSHGHSVGAPERQRKPEHRRIISRRVQRAALVGFGWTASLLAWTGVSVLLPRDVLPTPAEVAARMWEIVRSGEFLVHFQSSLLKFLLGFLVAVVFGSMLGYAMGRSLRWRAFFQDGVTIAGLIPSVAYATLSLIIFGTSLQGPVLAVALVSMPYLAINVAEGVKSVDRDLIRMSHVFDRSQAIIRRHVILPSIVPFLFVGGRLAFSVAWKVEALTEVFGGRNGVGFQIRLQYQLFSITGVLAWVFLFIGFMWIIERLVLVKIEDRVLAWRPKERDT